MKKVLILIGVLCFLHNTVMAESTDINENNTSVNSRYRINYLYNDKIQPLVPSKVEDLFFKMSLLSLFKSNADRVIKISDGIFLCNPSDKILYSTHVIRANIFIDKKDYKKAYEELSNAIDVKSIAKKEKENIHKKRAYIYETELKNEPDYNTEFYLLQHLKDLNYGISSGGFAINHLIGKTYEKLGKFNDKYYDKALDYYEIFLNSNDEEVVAASDVFKIYSAESSGDIYYKLNDDNNALVYYDKAISLAKLHSKHYFEWNMETLYIKKLLVLNREKRYADAVKVSDKLISISNDKNKYVYYNERGCNYYRLKEYEKALDDFKKQLELNPSRTSAYNNIALCLMHLGRYDEAMSNVDKALQMDTEVKARYANYDTKADILLHMSKPEEALTWINKIPQQDFKGSNHYTRGRIYLALGQKQQAKKDIKMAVKLEIPELEDARKILKALDE